MTVFKERLLSGAPLVGTFFKTPSAMLAEVITRTDLDVACIDAEHSAFDRRDIDVCLLALRAGGMPTLVRVPSCAPEHILNALDLGADGILAPHITSAQDAQALVDAATYGKGRGFSPSTRAGGYTGRTIAGHLKASENAASVIAQIEDVEALENLEEIMSVDGIDAVFVGRADLTVSMGYDDLAAPQVVKAVEDICKAAQAAGRRCGMFTADLAELPKWAGLGASFYLLGSDHGFMLKGAATMLASAKAALEA